MTASCLNLAISLLGQKCQLTVEGLLLPLIACITKLQRLDVLFDEIQLLVELHDLAVEHDVLALDDGFDIRIAGFLHDDVRHLEAFLALRLGAQARDDGFEAKASQLEHALVGERRRLVERQKHVAFLDGVAFADHHFLDDAALQMLHDLVVACGDKAALGNDGGGERCGAGPVPEAAEGGEQHGKTD